MNSRVDWRGTADEGGSTVTAHSARQLARLIEEPAEFGGDSVFRSGAPRLAMMRTTHTL